MGRYIIDILKRVVLWGITFVILNSLNLILGHQSVISLALIFIGVVLIAHLLLIPWLFICKIFSSFGIILGKIERKSKNFSKEDFENNKDYYREILKINSPLVIGYLDNFELNKNKLIAELLYLKNKKVIEIKENKIVKGDNFENTKIEVCEKELLNNVFYGQLTIVNINDFLNSLREKVECNAEKLSLVKLRNVKNNNFLSKLINCIFIICICFLAFLISKIVMPNLNFFEIIISELFVLFFVLIASLLFLPMMIFKIKYTDSKGNLYKRTSKGHELNQKLEGLKNYLKDYSLMDEREAKEIELWDDYLIYSVMFGQNKKIIEEYEKYIEIIE